MSKTIKFLGDELSPWADMSRVLNNMRSLTIMVGKRKVHGAMTLEIDDAGNVTLKVPEGKVPTRVAA